MKEIKDFLFAVTSPTFWLRNYRSSSKTDSILNDIIENKKEVTFGVSPYTVEANGYEIRVGNYPYCFGIIYQKGSVYKWGYRYGLPYRRTAYRFHKYLMQEASKEKKEEQK